MRNRFALVSAALVATIALAVATPREAHAQFTNDSGCPGGQPCGRINALPQGLIGTGFLGAEAVILVEGAVGVRNPFILLGTGALGLVAGGVGGYFIDAAIDSNTGDRMLPLVSTGLLVVGLGLIIPTAIMYVSATMYHPEETRNENEDNVGNQPLEESVGNTPASTPGATPSTGGGGGGRSTTRHLGPEALINFHDGHLGLGVPSVVVGSTYSIQEMHQFGVTPQTEVRVPVLTATF